MLLDEYDYETDIEVQRGRSRKTNRKVLGRQSHFEKSMEEREGCPDYIFL